MRIWISLVAAIVCFPALGESRKPQGCDDAHFQHLDAYLRQYGNYEPDRVDIERFIALNHRLCDAIIGGRMAEADAGVIYRHEVNGLAERVRQREVELLRMAGRIGAG